MFPVWSLPRSGVARLKSDALHEVDRDRLFGPHPKECRRCRGHLATNFEGKA
jgi:hypothetical protein